MSRFILWSWRGKCRRRWMRRHGRRSFFVATHFRLERVRPRRLEENSNRLTSSWPLEKGSLSPWYYIWDGSLHCKLSRYILECSLSLLFPFVSSAISFFSRGLLKAAIYPSCYVFIGLFTSQGVIVHLKKQLSKDCDRINISFVEISMLSRILNVKCFRVYRLYLRKD